MDNFRLHGLFTEALELSEAERGELSAEIERLTAALARLEQRKRAVDDVCRAIQRWADVCGFRVAPEAEEETDEGMVSLSEEEVSLIAYPGGTRPDPGGND
jgi:hypothetical protein